MARAEDGRPVEDAHASRKVVGSSVEFAGRIVSLRRDAVVLVEDAEPVTRDIVVHPGAVGVIALDTEDRVLLLQQYRHPVGGLLWEPAAGLLDIAGEDPLVAAQRELWEETGHRAGRWDVLLDYFCSPGGSDEAFRCYLARDLIRVPEDERHVGRDEEADLPQAWVPLDDAVGLVLSGALHNPSAVIGILAAAASRAGAWATLRPADAPWPWRFPGGGSAPA